MDVAATVAGRSFESSRNRHAQRGPAYGCTSSAPLERSTRRKFEVMNPHDELSEFLTTRRAKLSLDQVGLPDFGGRRRVPGLRREEVALLAGMSAEYYKRLERGTAAGVSESVIDGVSRALKLDEAEHAHLYDLVRAANAGERPQRTRTTRKTQVSSSTQQTIDAMSTVPVFVQNGRLDAVATNQLGHALFSPMFEGAREPINAARFTFLEQSAQTFYRDWEANARQIVAILRAEAGRSPHDRQLTSLVGELSTQSDVFRTLWAAHDVREHRTGIKSVTHPIVGELDLTFQAMDLSSDRGLTMIVFSAAPGSSSYDGLQLLANWAATSVSSSA